MKLKITLLQIFLLGMVASPVRAAVIALQVTNSFDPPSQVLTVTAINPEPGLFTFESSADLLHWTNVAANLTPAAQFVFFQSNVFAAPFQFFRVRLQPSHVPDQVLVRFRPGVSPAQQNDVLQSLGATNLETILTRAMQTNALEPIFRARTSNGVFSTVEALRARPEVDHAEPVWLARFVAAANDLLFVNGQQWGLYGSGTVPHANEFGSQATKAWAAGYTGSSSVCVGIIDTGIQWSHADLAANIWRNPGENLLDNLDNDGNGFINDTNGWDFLNNDATVDDGGPISPRHLAERHGTAVAGIIGGVGGNAAGIAGVNWRVSLIPVKVGEIMPFANNLVGTFPIPNAIKALDYLTDLKTLRGIPITVINASWGYYPTSVQDAGFLHEALIRAARADIVIVGAAGNDGVSIDGTPFYPACADTSVAAVLSSGLTPQSPAAFNAVIAVAAIDSSGGLAKFAQGASNFGQNKAALGAPGSRITTTVPSFVSTFPNEYDSDEGTSFAAPFVSGAVALYKSTHPNATALQIKQALLGAAAQTPTFSLMNNTITGGRLNLSTVISPGSLLCPDIWVDIAFTGSNPDGTSARPFRRIAQGQQAVVACTTTLHIRAGAYPELPLLLDKPVLFLPEGGPVSFGP